MTDDPKYVRFAVGDEWSALYIDGVLDTIGDTYLTDERIATLLGVVEQSSETMEHVNYRDDAPKTLADLRVLDSNIVAARRQADMLREQARELLQRAQDLETPK